MLRFERGLRDAFGRIVTRMVNKDSFHAWMVDDAEHQPYIILDAQEYGFAYIFEEAAKEIAASRRRRLFRLAYFTNSPWCTIDIEADIPADIVKLNGSLELEVYQKMTKPKSGRKLRFWDHAVRMAKKCLPPPTT